jgi:hypothetical protein
VDYPIAYVKRPLLVDDEGNIGNDDARRQVSFREGGDLYFRPRSSSSTSDRNLTGSITNGLGDVRDVEFSYDGSKILFALRLPLIEGADEEDQPTWNIWEYDIENDNLHRVIVSDLVAESGHDVAPHYLPDGRIVFSSTRQRQSRAILLDEGKGQFAALEEDRREPAFVLHVMTADGSDVKQISFNQSHDLDPIVNSNGEIVFTRWDNAGGSNAMHLYKINPDGTELDLLYGAISHQTGTGTEQVQFLQPRELPDGKLLSILQPFVGTDSGGNVVTIDTKNFVENTQPVAASAGLAGPAQVVSTSNDVRTDTAPSPGGRYDMVYPLWDGTERMFVSWSLCRLMEGGNIVPCTTERLANPGAVSAPPLYGIWLYNRADNTQLPVVVPEEGVIFTDVAAAQPRTTPPVILDKLPNAGLDSEWITERVGVLNIRSVYDVDGVDSATGGISVMADPGLTTADQRPARFLRLVKAVSIPDDNVRDFDNSAFGAAGAQGMREILGYAPIEPDGSVRVKVPADVAFTIDVLDKQGRRIGGRHENWLQVRPGEEMKCHGCHNPASQTSHGRRAAYNSAYNGAIVTGQPFPNTDSTIFADAGETMAEARTRISCITDCAAMEPTMDVIFSDVWTDETAAGRAKDADFAYRYADLTTPLPTASGCLTNWNSTCRSVINYETNIHLLWSLPRTVNNADATCISCHSPTDANNAVRIPLAQLDLSDGPSPEVAAHFNAYRELLFSDDEQDVIDGILQDVIDGATIAPSMSSQGAAASTRFFSRFDAGGTHQGYLSDAEKRLLAEWLDGGAQYFNNPFAAPEN